MTPPHVQSGGGPPMNAEQKPYAGNPHVRFDEGPLARASCTAGWGLLNRSWRFNPSGPLLCCDELRVGRAIARARAFDDEHEHEHEQDFAESRSLNLDRDD